MEYGYEKIDKLALDVLELSRNSLVVNLRFIDRAISMLKLVALHDFNNVAVDGENIRYDPVFVLESYKKEKEIPVRQYLHMILHCVFQHYYVNTLVDQDKWDLACDIAIENSINELELPCVTTSQSKMGHDTIYLVSQNVKYMTAEVIYHYLRESDFSTDEILDLKELFFVDDHSNWYKREENTESSQNDVSGNGSGKNSGGKQTDNINKTIERNEELASEWKKTSEQMQVDLRAFSTMRGDRSYGLVQNLKEVNREKYDYAAFLKKFAVLGETMKVNDDEFDYIFYTYGLQLYKNIPLIEPLEYKDVFGIKDFVIVIDTSGSTSGSLVQSFVQKTYNLLKQEESFLSKINLHIVQCDAEIQECVKITNQMEFDRYIKTMQIHGLGGTDFRPVFSYIDQLIDQHEFQNLKGMIYFTDGFGVFPEKQPNYKVAIVYVDDGFENPTVPVWAIKLVLKPDEVMEGL